MTELDLVHAVDPFLCPPVGQGPAYFRLHGRPAYNYRYHYSDEDLQQLAGCLGQRQSVRVLFNKTNMADDARRLKGLLGAS